jgi:hypothetical protein
MTNRSNKVIEIGKVVTETQKDSKATAKKVEPTKATSETKNDKQDNANAPTAQVKPKNETRPCYRGNPEGKVIDIPKTFNGIELGDTVKTDKGGKKYKCTVTKVFIHPDNGLEYVMVREIIKGKGKTFRVGRAADMVELVEKKEVETPKEEKK